MGAELDISFLWNVITILLLSSLKRAFMSEKNIKLIKGKEYFEGDEAIVLKTFINVLWKEKLEKLTKQQEPLRNHEDLMKDVIMHDVIIDDDISDEEKESSIISFGESINKFKFSK